ncbi:hypothetical protein NDU88_004267 [Pleurodeles waltl]|uniref:Uncharacterized protein n=1 Tax=Pleurodeles waltl TaxID=8319 RepID=A0AAV7NIW8_PLEWA|nr:hypothetical protein NDU88_004267 [Pleurodeles waltl]
MPLSLDDVLEAQDEDEWVVAIVDDVLEDKGVIFRFEMSKAVQSDDALRKVVEFVSNGWAKKGILTLV